MKNISTPLKTIILTLTDRLAWIKIFEITTFSLRGQIRILFGNRTMDIIPKQISQNI